MMSEESDPEGISRLCEELLRRRLLSELHNPPFHKKFQRKNYIGFIICDQNAMRHALPLPGNYL